jgi:hypothetical protein
MFCPQCGSTQPEELKFCKQCGANLSAVRMAVTRPEAAEGFDWSKSWVAEMFMSSDEKARRQAELELREGRTMDVLRRKEIKAGIITASVGLAFIVVLFVLMGGIIASGRVSDAAAEILSRIWIVGILPVLVGGALIFNGMFITKRRVSLGQESEDSPQPQIVASEGPEYLPPADTNELFPAGYSVTDATTRHLKTPNKQ